MNSLSIEAYKLIKDSKNIIVVTGAGISVSSGIPDFRSPESGLYATIGKKYDLTRPEDVFDINFFRKEPRLFYEVISTILAKEVKPTPTHKFIKMLQDKKKLLRNYTQNIDGLERKVGIDDSLLVEAHGSFNDAQCTNYHQQDVDRLIENIQNRKITKCTECSAYVKPTITFFGQALPERYEQLIQNDLKKCDLLIIIGTSLKVKPIGNIPALLPYETPKIVINLENCVHNLKDGDVLILGDCDSETVAISNLLNE